MKKVYLDFYRKNDRKKLLEKHFNLYNKNKKTILKILKNTDCYHGTGAYQYFYKKDKYSSSEPLGIKFVLRNIITKGLKPGRDLFNDTFKTGTKKSISLTINRVYARTYSELFFEEGTRLNYTYGPPLFWNIGVFTRVVVGWIKAKFKKNNLNKDGKIARKRFKIMVKNWTKSFRNDKRARNNMFVFVFGGKSDIKGNFGIILGIKKNVIKPIKINYPNISMDEVRTNNQIKPKDFTHIQVPLAKIRFVKKEHDVLRTLKV